MTKSSKAAGATRLGSSLPEEIVIWEILVRLPPKSVLRSRAVCLAWLRGTSTRSFLEVHHGRQPCLPMIVGSEYLGASHNKNILAFDQRAADAKLQHVVRLEHSFYPKASCDGLLILISHCRTGTCFSICNPATRQHVPLPQLSGFSLLAMYPHRSTGEYRLLVQRIPTAKVGYYVYTLGSHKPPRSIRGQAAAPPAYLRNHALVHDSLHWHPQIYHSDPQQYQLGSESVIVFDTISESFRQMCAPVVPARSYIFEIDGTLGIYSYKPDIKIIDIWMLHDYESEVWSYKYRVQLPVIEMKERFGGWWNDNWYINVHSLDGDIILLVNYGRWIFHVDTDGKLVDSFLHDSQDIYACQLRLKQTLISHTFFTALKGSDVNASPFV